MPTAVAIGFGIVLAAIVTLLAITYYTFVRMNAEVRRARMFLMAGRIQRFLLAFLMGFGALVVSFMGALMGFVIPPTVSSGIAFFFFGTVVYGILEIFFVARPVPRWSLRGRRDPHKLSR